MVACGQQSVPTQAPAEPTQAPATAAATEAPASTEAPTEEPAIPWKDPYETSKPELCPEDTTPTDQPIFGEPTPETLDGQPVFVQRGLYGNPQNEVFRIDVTGVTEAAVTAYTAALKVCLDYVTTGVEAPEPQEQPTPSAPPSLEPFGANPEDLIIELFVQGVYTGDQKPEDVAASLKDIVAKPVENWPDQFEGTKLVPPEVANDFVIDLVLDPKVSNGATHQYVERSATRIYVTASVQYGAGSVKAGICRGSYSTTPFTGMTVAYTGTQTASRSDNPGTGYYYKYDLGVKGNPNATYRISGRLYWGGWSANYWDLAPTGSAKSCNP